MSAADSGPMVTLAWEPQSSEPIWRGRAAAARGSLEEGTYFATHQIVGVTGEGVLVTAEKTGSSTYFLATADAVKQHLADISCQVLTAVPDAASWTAPSIHDTIHFNDEVVGVRTTDGSHQIFTLGADAAASIQAIHALEADGALDLPNPVHIDSGLRDHVAFMIEVGVVLSGAATAPVGYDRATAAGRVLDGVRHNLIDQDQLIAAQYGQNYPPRGRDATQRLADDARQDRYWTEKLVQRFAGELEAVHYPGNIARTAAHERADTLAWTDKAAAVIHAATATSTLDLLVDLATRARQLRGGEEPIPGTITRWELGASLAAAAPGSRTRDQVEMRAALLQLHDLDISQAVVVNNGTFGAAPTTTPASLTHDATYRSSAGQPRSAALDR